MAIVPDTHEITPEEMEEIQEIKKRVGGSLDLAILEDDHFFKRFLRARNHDVDQTEAMLVKHINWRKANNVDTILKDFKPPDFAKYLGINHIGYDPEGCPILYCHFGYIDTKGLHKCVRNKYIITQFFIHLFETYVHDMKERSEKIGKPIDQFVYIFNFENTSIFDATHKPTLDVLSLLIQMYDGNYPERLKTFYVINASFAFSIYFAVLKPFMSSRTLKKLKFFGKEGWKEEFQTIIERDKVPAFLGGNLTDPDGDPTCKSWFHLAGPVPDFYYKSRRRSSVIPGAKWLVVPRMSKVEIKLEVLYPGSMVEWEFQTKSRDIGFTVLYKKNGTDRQVATEIIPRQRVDTEGKSECQMVRCEKAGVYILVFDNSFSWLRQKEIFYRASVTSAQDMF